MSTGMKERSIILKPWEVRAVLDGRKTMTRLVVKQQPQSKADIGHFGHGMPFIRRADKHPLRCPYGQPGDRLWVRETFIVEPHPSDVGLTRDDIPRTWDAAVAAAGAVHYAADPGALIVADGRRWSPSIHMPRWANRITLEVTGVRVERLQDISREDALAEGIADMSAANHIMYGLPGDGIGAQHPVRAFWLLWESINGAGSWEANPYVWVVEFKRIEQRAVAA